MTYYDLVNEARYLLQDEGAGVHFFRYSDKMLLNGLNRGLQELARIRPDAMYDRYAGNSLNTPEVSDVASPGLTLWTDDFDLDNRFWSALVHYVQGVTMLSDDEYSDYSDKVNIPLQMFRRHVLSV